MRVIIVGAGEVGSSIAGSLANGHEVVVVDVDGERVESLTYSLDVLPIEGDGTSLETLEEAGIDEADMLIASTNSDEANIVACTTAKTVSSAFTIARVKKTDYLRTWERSTGTFGVDFMVCTDLLAAQTIVRIAGLPGAQDVDAFSGGQVQMAEFEVPPESPIADRTVREADRFEALTFAAILRNGGVTIPRGTTVIEAGDQVVVIGTPGSVRNFSRALAPAPEPGVVDDVVVVGGSEIGFQTARLFEEQGVAPKLIEASPDRARELAERLTDTIVLENEATDRRFLERQHVGDADLVVCTLESDERNLLVSLLAKRLGAGRTVAVVNAGDYVDLFEAVGVDVAVNPREVTAEEITRFTREEHTQNVALIESDTAEVIEIEVDDDSALAGRSIREVSADFPTGVVVGAITRDGAYVTPRGDTVVQPGDHAVVFVDANVVDEVSPRL